MNYDEKSIEMHKKYQGKIHIDLNFDIKNKDDLSIAYTPGVAAVSKKIYEDKSKKYELTSIGNTIAVISNGTAVLGLGSVGAEAAYPVMEGKSALFKKFGSVNAVPIVVDIKDKDEFVNFVEKISVNYSGINLEDIKAPECFYIEEKLKEKLNIPVFHDDQHGTAIVVLAALKNALKLANKNFEDVKIVISGAGSAGLAIAKLLLKMNPKELLVLDSKGILTKNRQYREEEFLKKEISLYNKNDVSGNLKDALKNADVFIGVSKPNIMKKEDIDLMNEKPIIFALSNPIPEISYEDAKEKAFIVATGRSDYKNQINNVLAFPGLFKGLLKVKAKKITEEMKLKAADAIANTVKDLDVDTIVPSPFSEVHENVALAVEEAYKEYKESVEKH